MKSILQEFAVRYQYPVHFTTEVFACDNPVLAETLGTAGPGRHKVLFVVDDGLAGAHAGLIARISDYAHCHRRSINLVCPPLLVSGGEDSKNTLRYVELIQSAISDFGICRQSFVVAVGGGALLDMAGFAAAVSHRGVRLVRIPTTALSQDDSGVGVKNAINMFDKKNFTGSFAPPYAVINDFAFLRSLPQRDWISGLAEAVKVALLKDRDFFEFLERHKAALITRDETAMRFAVYRSAELHVQHIGKGGDPFEMTSSRPLDLGHWAAHKLELLSGFRLRHGEAVAIGLALDTTYSWLAGLLDHAQCVRILSLLGDLGFELYAPELELRGPLAKHERAVMAGLREFREHLGGELTVTLLRAVGEPVEVHEMKVERVETAIQLLRDGRWDLPVKRAPRKEVQCEQLSC